MRISVALCTYNGTRFLKRQLASLLTQTRQPDELIVCDDCSSDGTVQVLMDFQKQASFPVKIQINVLNVGPAKNFEQAIALCTGDLISLCDQDDVWLPNKLEVAERYFIQFPSMDAVFSDGLVVDATLELIGYKLWDHVGFNAEERRMMQQQRGLEVLLKHVVVTGATLSIRARLRERIFPIPTSWMHDAWIALMAASSSALGAVEEPLFLYRQHEANQIGARQRSLTTLCKEALRINREGYYAVDVMRYREALTRLNQFSTEIRPDAIELMNAKLNHLEIRSSLPATRILRLPGILVELVSHGYRRYSVGWEVAIKDFLLRAESR